MSHGKDAALDLRYGRQGGRRTSAGPVDAALHAINQARTHGLRDGTWPDGTPKGDRECREPRCGRPLDEHTPPCPLCGRAPEHHQDGDLKLERAGRARMAAARRAAGQPLDPVDLEILGGAA